MPKSFNRDTSYVSSELYEAIQIVKLFQQFDAAQMRPLYSTFENLLKNPKYHSGYTPPAAEDMILDTDEWNQRIPPKPSHELIACALQDVHVPILPRPHHDILGEDWNMAMAKLVKEREAALAKLSSASFSALPPLPPPSSVTQKLVRSPSKSASQKYNYPTARKLFQKSCIEHARNFKRVSSPLNPNQTGNENTTGDRLKFVEIDGLSLGQSLIQSLAAYAYQRKMAKEQQMASSSETVRKTAPLSPPSPLSGQSRSKNVHNFLPSESMVSPESSAQKHRDVEVIFPIRSPNFIWLSDRYPAVLNQESVEDVMLIE